MTRLLHRHLQRPLQDNSTLLCLAQLSCSLFKLVTSWLKHMFLHWYFLLRPADTPLLSGGGLPNSYKFAQIHFHWGAEDSKGEI